MNVLISSYHMNLVYDKYKKIFKKKNIIVDKIIRNPSVKEKELIPIIHKYDGVICSDDEITKKVLHNAKKLKVISKWGTGIDSIDSYFAKKKNIKIFNTPGAFTKGVAQYAIGMLFNLSRKLTKSDRSVKSGKWEKYQGIEIENKRIGIIGLGKIGSQIIRYLKAFDIQIYGNDKKKNINKSLLNKGVKIASIYKIFSKCDIIIICVDLNKSSFHLIGTKQMMLLDENKILINVSRGPDISASMDGNELRLLMKASNEIFLAKGNYKGPVKEEKSTINFAFASLVTTKDIKKGEKITKKNIFPKRPGTGDFKANSYFKVIGKKAKNFIKKNTLLKRKDII